MLNDKRNTMTDREKQLLQDMKELVSDINRHFQNANMDARVPLIELEILSSNIKALYDKSVVLKYLQANIDSIKRTEPAATAAPAPPKPVEQAPQPVEVKPDPAPPIAAEPQSTPEPEPVAPQPVAERPALNQQFSTEQQTVGEKLQRRPISDLTKAVGINQKYLLMNDLFEGENVAYNEAINRLNNFASGHEAIQYVNKELAPKYGWDTEDHAVRSFVDLVERRYL